MTDQEIHIKTPISRDDLETVVTGLEIACGGIRIDVTETFDLIVKDQRQAEALKALFSSNSKTPEAAEPTKEKQKKAPKAVIEKPKRASPKYIPYIFLSGPRINDKITGGALGRMLKAGNLAAGTRMSHPTRGELVVVTNGQGTFTLQGVPA